jgi:ribosome biogenesis protein MAK21
MGKKRTHAETKDGFTKPSPDKSRMSAKNDKKDGARNDKKDKRKDGDDKKSRSQLVRIILRKRFNPSQC